MLVGLAASDGAAPKALFAMSSPCSARRTNRRCPAVRQRVWCDAVEPATKALFQHAPTMVDIGLPPLLDFRANSEGPWPYEITNQELYTLGGKYQWPAAIRLL